MNCIIECINYNQDELLGKLPIRHMVGSFSDINEAGLWMINHIDKYEDMIFHELKDPEGGGENAKK